MIYPASFEQKIGFDRVREQIAALCTMRAARERIAAEGFSTSPREIEHRLALADEMRLVLDMERDFPGGEYPDVDHIVAKLRVEGTFLDVEEVVTLGRALAAVGGIVEFLLNRAERYPVLHARTRGVEAFPEIVRRIATIVDRFGNVRDNASPALQEIRRAIREREGQAAKRLQAVLAAAKDVPALETALRASLAASFRTQPKLFASPEIKGGMEVSFKNGEVYFDFTSDAITELVAEYIGPRLAKLLGGEA